MWQIIEGHNGAGVTYSAVATSVCSYSWKTTEWTECRVDVLLSQQDRRRGNQTGLCGGGIQTREVYCVQTSSDTSPSLGSLRSKEGDSPSMLFFCHLLLFSCTATFSCAAKGWRTF